MDSSKWDRYKDLTMTLKWFIECFDNMPFNDKVVVLIRRPTKRDFEINAPRVVPLV